jgi:hypothetical protein
LLVDEEIPKPGKSPKILANEKGIAVIFRAGVYMRLTRSATKSKNDILENLSEGVKLWE